MTKFVMLLAVIVAVLAGVWALSSRPVQREIGRLLENPRRIVEPAPLCEAHSADPGCSDCLACHTLTAAVPSEKCLSCHTEIGNRIESKSGHHGRDLAGECVECHTDHAEQIIRFDRDTFNHRRALFPLEGSHGTVECEECHQTKDGLRYLGLPSAECSDCHDDPHAGSLTKGGRDCLSCHDQDEWTGTHLSFVHNRDSDFPLHGGHAAVACAECHAVPSLEAPLGQAAFLGLGRGCVDCHADPHGGSLAPKECSACHDDAGWIGTNVTFDHGRDASFSLDPVHRDLDCAACHESLVYRPEPQTCASCHTDMAGFLAGEISVGEDEEKWGKSPHAGLVGCADCHAADEPHQSSGSYARKCAACHTEHYLGMYLERTAHLSRLAAESSNNKMALLLRVGSHNYIEAEKRARALVLESKDE